MPVTFEQAVLPNGLTVVGEVDPSAHTSACGFFVRTGARDEEPRLMGVSHFLEHMMFKGTAKRSADDVNREFDEIGANYNAYTSAEITCFYASMLPPYFEKGADILADILRPALRQGDFDTEKGVILEEIAMYKDNPFWVLYEAALEKYFGAHPLAHRVLGTDDTIRALKRDEMQRYFDARYSADNTVVAVAGKVDFPRAVEQFARLCGGWGNTGATRDTRAPGTGDHEFTVKDPKVNRAYLLMITPGPSATDPRRYAAGMLAQVLGGGDNSRLHWALVEPGIAEEAASSFDPRDGCGDYYVFASCDPERADEVWGLVEKELSGLVASLTPDDLERLRNKTATSVTLAGERPAGRMQRLGRMWTYERTYRPLEKELDAINAVTLDDLRSVAADFPFRPRTVGRMLPG